MGGHAGTGIACDENVLQGGDVAEYKESAPRWGEVYGVSAREFLRAVNENVSKGNNIDDACVLFRENGAEKDPVNDNVPWGNDVVANHTYILP